MADITWQPQGFGDPTMFGTDLAGQQQGAVDLMRTAATGGAPSAAQSMLQRSAMENQNRLQAALASNVASNRGLGFGARQVAAQSAAAQAAGQSADATRSQMATMRAQEMAQARSALGQQLSGMRGQDIAGTGLGLQQQQMMAEQDRARLEAQIAAAQIQQQREAAAMQMAGGLAGGIGSFVGGLISDERVKTNTSDADGGEMKALLGALKAKRFDYADGYGDSDHLGIMAQDLEKSRLGRTMVKEVNLKGSPVKTVDGKRALAAALAASAHLHERISSLEGVRK